jgi:hypothetical protein
MEATRIDRTHICRYCMGTRVVRYGKCCGCGMPEHECRPIIRKHKSKVSCPGCGVEGHSISIGDGQRRCRKCMSVYEGADFVFLDHRPDISFEKKERLEALAADRRRQSRRFKSNQ